MRADQRINTWQSISTQLVRGPLLAVQRAFLAEAVFERCFLRRPE